MENLFSFVIFFLQKYLRSNEIAHYSKKSNRYRFIPIYPFLTKHLKHIGGVGIIQPIKWHRPYNEE